MIKIYDRNIFIDIYIRNTTKYKQVEHIKKHIEKGGGGRELLSKQTGVNRCL